ncbi:MAG TPA: Gfo/Idh/MocA family oxidoreductase [Ohtaekwangia sp.]|nr:Gfo/Idh/MocA family oxidoreductase [Ohtaekwangia sp.]
MTNKKVKVAVAGVGFIGPVHIESIRRAGNLEVTALFHPFENEAAEKAAAMGIPKYYVDYDKMVKEADFDCVHICTPNNLHYPMAKAALLAGKHVVCEKPLATTVKEAEELLALATEKKLIHAVSFNLRYYPLVRQMKAMREKGELGTVYSIMGSYLQDWLFYATDYNWRLEPDKSGDSKAIADIGSHLIDLIEYISGLSITEVMADFSTVHPTRKKPLKAVETYSGKMLAPEDYADVPIRTEDYASVLLRFNNGSKGVVTVSQVAAGRKNRLSLEIAGSNVTMAWNSEQPNDLWIGKRNEANQQLMRDPSLVYPEARSIIAYPGGHNEGFGDTSKQLFRDIYAAVREGKQPAKPTYPTFAEGLRELKLCDGIVESHRQQKWIKV